jgi:hypothetical protein
MKKILLIAGICISVFIATLAAGSYLLYQKPSIRFLLIISEIINPSGFEKKESVLKLRTHDTPMTIFTPVDNKPGKYYFFLHGFTPEEYRHPTLIKMAAAISCTTGRTVFIPFIKGITKQGWTLAEVAEEVGNVYLDLRKQHPGKYNAFGACVAGTGLLVAFNTIPVSEYPDKLFLYGPFSSGKDLVAYYNKAGVEIDYIVKLANALNSDDYTEKQKHLVSKAILASKPGTTDREEMRAILGDALYNRIDKSAVDNREFMSIDEGKIFTKGKKVPNSKFYIIHSNSDEIIPYSFGLSLHKFLLSCGAKSRFAGTELFGHTSSSFSISDSYKEIRNLINFLDDLFEEKDGNNLP